MAAFGLGLLGLLVWGTRKGDGASPLRTVRGRQHLLPVLILQVDNRPLSPEWILDQTNHVSLSAVINYNYAVAHNCECAAWKSWSLVVGADNSGVSLSDLRSQQTTTEWCGSSMTRRTRRM